MNRRSKIILAIVLLAPLLSGCWAGGLISERCIVYKHKSVSWVYQAGGQIGSFWFLPVLEQNDILDVRPGDNCIFVTEGQTGGQCSATPQASLELTHAISIDSGRPTVGRGKPREVNRPKPIYRGDGGQWETPIDKTLSVYTSSQTGQLYILTPSQIEILHIRYSDPEIKYKPWLGVTIAAFRLPGDVLILGLSEGYVLCIDLKVLEADVAAQTRNLHGGATDSKRIILTTEQLLR